MAQLALPTRSHPPPSAAVSPYPTAYQIEEIFANRLVAGIFNPYCTDPVDIDIIGQEFHHGGHYKTIQRFEDEVFGEYWQIVKPETVRTEVVRVIGGGESAWAAVDIRVTADTKYGEFSHRQSIKALLLVLSSLLIHLQFGLFSTHASFGLDKRWHSEFCELVCFNSQGKIAQIREFWDTGHIHSHVNAHRSSQKEAK